MVPRGSEGRIAVGRRLAVSLRIAGEIIMGAVGVTLVFVANLVADQYKVPYMQGWLAWMVVVASMFCGYSAVAYIQSGKWKR